MASRIKNPYTKLFNSFKKLINLVEAEKFKGKIRITGRSK